MIKLEIIGAAKVVSRLKRFPDNARIRLIKTVNGICAGLVRGVKESKLTGDPLHVRTGRLRRSIHAEVSSSETAVTGIVGTNVKYAAAHEYGFQGIVTVRDHLRRIKGTSKLGLIGQTTVEAHNMKMNMPERSFLRSALKDMKAEILERLTGAMRDIEGGPQ